MEWYEHDLSGPDYDGPAYAWLLVRLVGIGLAAVAMFALAWGGEAIIRWAV